MKALMLVTCLAGLTVAAPEPSYTEEDLYFMSRIVQAEAGYCEREMIEGVASVIINRVNDERFPDTVYGVVSQSGQYSTFSTVDSQVPTDDVIEVCIDVLENGSKFPPDVIYQANVILGPVYKTLSTSYSTMFFCTG